VDLRMSGRASAAACARGLPQGAAGTRARDLSGCRRANRARVPHFFGGGQGPSCGVLVGGPGTAVERFLTAYTARDVVTRARLAFNRRGRMLALALELTANVGAPTACYVPLRHGYS